MAQAVSLKFPTVPTPHCRMFMVADVSAVATSWPQAATAAELPCAAVNFPGFSVEVSAWPGGILPPLGLSLNESGFESGFDPAPGSTSNESVECHFCRCHHTGRVKLDKKQRAAMQSIAEKEVLELLLTQLSMRALSGKCFDALFPFLQKIHRRLAASSPESSMSCALQRNLQKSVSRMSCQQMIRFLENCPSLDAHLMRQLKEQLKGSQRTAPRNFTASSVWL